MSNQRKLAPVLEIVAELDAKKPKAKKKRRPGRIPVYLESTIFEWHCAGLTYPRIIDKLKQLHNLSVCERTLARCIRIYREEKFTQVQAVVSDRAQKQISTDLDTLERMKSQLLTLVEELRHTDHKLYLAAADRVAKFLQMSFALSSDNGELHDNTQEKDDILNSLLDKLSLK